VYTVKYPTDNKAFLSIEKCARRNSSRPGAKGKTNGLLRRYFPKGTDFRTISEKEVAIVVKNLNNRPGECLNYQTPHEVYRKALGGAL
jgi:IS30 family transposase